MILEAGACEVGRCEVLAIGDYDHGSELEDVHADADDATDGDNTVIGVTVAAVVWMVMAVVGDSIGPAGLARRACSSHLSSGILCVVVLMSLCVHRIPHQGGCSEGPIVYLYDCVM